MRQRDGGGGDLACAHGAARHTAAAVGTIAAVLAVHDSRCGTVRAAVRTGKRRGDVPERNGQVWAGKIGRKRKFCIEDDTFLPFRAEIRVCPLVGDTCFKPCVSSLRFLRLRFPLPLLRASPRTWATTTACPLALPTGSTWAATLGTRTRSARTRTRTSTVSTTRACLTRTRSPTRRTSRLLRRIPRMRTAVLLLRVPRRRPMRRRHRLPPTALPLRPRVPWLRARPMLPSRPTFRRRPRT